MLLLTSSGALTGPDQVHWHLIGVLYHTAIVQVYISCLTLGGWVRPSSDWGDHTRIDLKWEWPWPDISLAMYIKSQCWWLSGCADAVVLESNHCLQCSSLLSVSVLIGLYSSNMEFIKTMYRRGPRIEVYTPEVTEREAIQNHIWVFVGKVVHKPLK